jgi:hypothetical protein
MSVPHILHTLWHSSARGSLALWLSGELGKQDILCCNMLPHLKTKGLILSSLCLLLERQVGDNPLQACDKMLW